MSEKNVTMLSTKNLRVLIKKNATVKSLCTEYNCTEEELLARIDSLYHLNPGDAKKIVASLRANEKRAMKKFKRSGTGGKHVATKPKPTPADAPVAESVLDVAGNNASEAESNVAPTDTEATDTMKPISEWNDDTNGTEAMDTMKVPAGEESNPAEALMHLDTMRSAPDTTLLTESPEELRKLEEAMATAVTNSENLHKLYATKHRKVREEFTKISEELDGHRRAIASCKSKFEGLFKEEAEISREIQTIHGRIVSERNYLEKIREKIRELERIVIFAYNNGEITIERNGFAPDDSGYEEIFNRLVVNDACSELRAREIKLLARVMAIVDNIDRHTEVIFETPEIEAAYNAVK